MDGTCLDQRSRMTTERSWNVTDRQNAGLRESCESRDYVVPCTGRNLGCIPHRLAAGVLRESKTEDDEKNKDLFRYVITSNGAIGDRCKRKEDIVQGSDKKEDALSILSDCRKEKFGIAAHVRPPLILLRESFLLRQAALFTERCSGGCASVRRNMEEILSKSDCDVRRTSVLFSYVKRKGIN